MFRRCAPQRTVRGVARAMWMSNSPRARAPHDVLGVPLDAPNEQIKAAYRALAMKHHPDRNPDDGDSADDSSSDESAIAQVLREHYDSRTGSQAAAHPASAPRATAPVAAATAARGAGERPPSPPRGRAVRFPPQSPIQRSPRQLD